MDENPNLNDLTESLPDEWAESKTEGERRKQIQLEIAEQKKSEKENQLKLAAEDEKELNAAAKGCFSSLARFFLLIIAGFMVWSVIISDDPKNTMLHCIICVLFGGVIGLFIFFIKK